jgi:putative glycosyltransferase (TIGR04372 family)
MATHSYILFASIKRFISVIIYFPLALIFRIFAIQVPYFFTERIGHLVVDPESFLKEQYLLNGRYPSAVLLAPPNLVANSQLLEYWKEYFLVIQNPVLCRFLLPLSFHPLLKLEDKYAATMHATNSAYKISAEWGSQDGLLRVSDHDLAFGSETLLKMGLNKGDWFVCIHAREGGYSPSDEHLHSFRNTPIEDLFPAIKFITSQGGKCIRMGDSSMKPAPADIDLIDYALSPFKSDLMDIFLCSECLFFLGSNSGIFDLSTLFGTPVAAVNLAPMSILARGLPDLSIPMLYKDSKSDKLISFSEIMETNRANYRTSEEFSNAGITLVRNKPEEILELVTEQYHRVRNTYTEKDDNQVLQKKYKSLFKEGHYSFGYASKIGEDFLQRYSKFLS